MQAVGRQREKALFQKLFEEKRSHFTAVYGRRKIGKTFLIKSHFQNLHISSYRIANVGMNEQLDTFSKSLMVCFHHLSQIKNALGIGGVYSETSSWISNSKEQNT